MTETDSKLSKILTIGHSNRTIEAFIELLKAHNVSRVVDVRKVPRSRHNPQFNRDTLPASLDANKIGYTHLPGLGGLRHPRPDSPNMGWRNTSFRGFADYMQTAEFDSSLEALLTLSRQDRVAIMCAEAVPWRCHRSLIADALVVRGYQVGHIMSEKHVEGTQIAYPPEQPALL